MRFSDVDEVGALMSKPVLPVKPTVLEDRINVSLYTHMHGAHTNTWASVAPRARLALNPEHVKAFRASVRAKDGEGREKTWTETATDGEWHSHIHMAE